MKPSDALRDLTPRFHEAAAQGAWLAAQEAQARGADDAEKAAILTAYARAWERLDAWLHEQSGEPYTPPALPGTPPAG